MFLKIKITGIQNVLVENLLRQFIYKVDMYKFAI